MRELLSENQQLPMRNFQALRRGGDFRGSEQPQFSLNCWRRACFCFYGLSRFHHIDANRNAVLRFNLPNRNGAICAVERPFNQTALGVARTICKLWHRVTKVNGAESYPESSNRKIESLSLSRLKCYCERRIPDQLRSV